MRFSNVAVASLGVTIPPIVKSSRELEQDLAPLYQRLKLPEGRLELMSGITQRRFFEDGQRLSDISAQSCHAAIEAADIDAKEIGCLIHASVCREFLEPATACRVHHLCGLPPSSWAYDVSNACLGVLNGMVQIATLIESKQIRAGLVVGTENASGLLRATISQLNSDETLTRKTVKPAFASLTIGSGSCAVLLVDTDIYESENRITAAAARAHTQHHELCQSHNDAAGDNMLPTMDTDSEQLLHAGIQTGKQTFEDFLKIAGLQREDFGGTVCHQVGVAHRKLMLSELQLPESRDFASYPMLGNTGSVALPTALAVGLHTRQIAQPNRLALLGIGSGINSVMLDLSAHNIPVTGLEKVSGTFFEPQP